MAGAGPDETFTGDDAKQARKRLGLTQFEVAVELGVTAQHISGFENGRYQLGPKVRHQLAELLGLPTAGLGAAPESKLEALEAQMADLKKQVAEVLARLESVADDLSQRN